MILSSPDQQTQGHENQARAQRVYNYSQSMGLVGYDKNHNLINAQYEIPPYGLAIPDRIDIFRLCSPVFGVVSNRMNRISSYKWEIEADKKLEDQTADQLKSFKDLYDEISTLDDLRSQAAKVSLVTAIRKELYDCLPDLSNFDRSLLRWGRRIKQGRVDRCQEVKDWMAQPNLEDDWVSFVKKWVFDLHVHGMSVIYKEPQDGKVENIYLLPGGSVVPVRSRRIGGYVGYAQIIMGSDINIFFQDEVSVSQYMPSSAYSIPFIPLEALVNKIIESMHFDKLMADQADGTKPIEKIVAMGKSNPFGDPSAADLKSEMPLPVEEQKKIEEAINLPKKGAIRVLTGYGTPTVIDLSRENTMQIQLERQKMIREEVGLVFGATNLEMNLSGSDSVSGRSTAEAQEREGFEKSTLPILAMLENKINADILPFRFGVGYKINFQASKNEMDQFLLYKVMLDSGLVSINELRTEELNRMPFKGDQYNAPSEAVTSTPDGSSVNPINMRNIE